MTEKEYVFAIDAEDTFLHVGRIDELLPHLGVADQERRRHILDTFEIYDSTGTRMDIVPGDDGTHELVAKDQEPEDLTLLRDRIDSALGTIQVRTTWSNSTGAKNIYTDLYTPNGFNATSAAGAIIAGVALAVQGMVTAAGDAPLTSEEMRDVLDDPATGTASADPPTDTTGVTTDVIGVMPDLKKIITNTLQIT